MDGEQDQRLVAGGGKKAGDQHIGIDHRPDHLTPPGVTGSCLRRCAGDLGVDISGRQRIEAAPLRAAPRFLKPIRRRRRRADKILHAHDDDRGLAAPVDDEALIVFDGEVHDLPELGAGHMGVAAAVHVTSFPMMH
jgi:hypothetical protein